MTPQKPWRPLKLGASFDASFSPDGAQLVVISKRVSLWDVFERRKLYDVQPFPHPSVAAFAPDGNVIAIKSTANAIVTIDATTGKTIFDFKTRKEGPSADISFSPCGEYLIDSDADQTLFVRRVRDGRIEFRRPSPPEVEFHAAIPYDGGKRWLLHFWRHAHDEKSPPRPDYIEFWTWPFGNGPDAVWETDAAVTTALPTRDGTTLALVEWTAPRLRLFDVASRRELASRATSSPATCAAWSGDEARLIVPEKDCICVYDATDAGISQLKRIALHMESSVATSPHHRLVALSSWDCGFIIDPATVDENLLPVPPHMLEASKRVDEEMAMIKSERERG